MGDDAATAAILEDARGLAAQLAPAHRRAPMPRNLRRDDLARISPAETTVFPTPVLAPQMSQAAFGFMMKVAKRL